VRMRRLAARRLGGPEDTKPAMRRHRVAVAGALVAMLLMVTGTAVRGHGTRLPPGQCPGAARDPGTG
jgi:hypothetical protein